MKKETDCCLPDTIDAQFENKIKLSINETNRQILLYIFYLLCTYFTMILSKGSLDRMGWNPY